MTAGRSLPRVWADRWASEPAADTIFVASVDGDPADNRRWVNAGELDARSRDAASELCRLGLAEHSRILWNADRSLASVIACLGVLRGARSRPS